jgi:hypothetical protein
MDDSTLPEWMHDSLPTWVTNEKKLIHWRLIQQLKLFRLRRGIKKGEYIYKQDLENYKSDMVSIYEEILKKQLSETQVDYLASLTNPKKINYYFNQMMRSALWEIAHSKKSYVAINRMFGNNQETSKDFFRQMKKALGFKHLSITVDKEDENIAWYRNTIIKTLETSEDRIRSILDEIKKVCEYDSVLAAIQSCIHINTLPKRDRRKIYKEKQKFQKIKKETIKNLQFLNASKKVIEEIEKKEYRNNENDGWVNYEKTLEHAKKILYNDLVLMCGTGKKRAATIAKILEYI